ncbi:hypothetical protein A1Q1_05321 [Trichosporon asahii var. asahii CBS 2479]|uniref:Transcriptional coactivator HFI1/ADA1 n=1 Tax=Trichosporon asahii var. asahii (strain ATCC 90039 / CBS 2479 / JCM 2466 / KCTC 7840 / NBRC 103889/ NCYC 2677 / UAMH 7654) TaxID=1186058 RepID=J4U779_TRIAS|nr:hypothetical protein A1Q1_05321 [Trichosporon asahii var. asahii CBS 2479]EJT46110.1 hypothetical protein A1Q1_05321 [Trichosporon asahii var. asahii CBS 2479]
MSGHASHALATPGSVSAPMPSLTSTGPGVGAPSHRPSVPTPLGASVPLPSTPASPASNLPIPFQRIDTHRIKQQLYDALGEAGLPYWKALNGYLLGQVGRDELVALVRGWLKGKSLQLHNQLLTSLLHNASTPQIANQSASSLHMNKRRRGGIDAPDFDSDATYIEPMDRVANWAMGLGGRERERVRRAVDAEPEEVVEADEFDAMGKKRKWSAYQSGAAHPTLAQSGRNIPSSHQLALRLAQVAKTWNLEVAPDATKEVGEFMGVGLHQHLGDVLHSLVHLTGRDRPGEDTLRVPPGVHEPSPEAPDIPTPTLGTLQYLFTLAPSLHPQASLTIAEVEASKPREEREEEKEFDARTPRPAANLLPSATPQTQTVGLPGALPAALPNVPSPVKAASTLHAAAGQGKIETVSQTLQDTGLLKIDKAGRGEEGEGGDRKREKKHNLHWKYEDPALILKDLFG